MKNLLNAITPARTPQTEGLDPRQIKNNAGGYVYGLSDEARLTRFLILGTDGGTFYAGERAHTTQATEFVKTFVQVDAAAALRITLDVVRAARAPKPDPALLVLALIAKTALNAADRQAAWAALPEVARTGTMLLHFLAFADALGGWGRLTRRGVANVYETADVGRLALWAVKYKSRDGWSQRDALRKSHPKVADPERNAVLKFMANGVLPALGAEVSAPALRVIEGHLLATSAGTDRDAATLMRGYGLPIEAVPTHLRGAEVYRAAMQTNGLTWLLRNLGNLGRVGVLTANDPATVQAVTGRLTDPGALKRGRIHPLDVLKARLVYAQGRGVKGKSEWLPVPQVIDALEDAFHLAFGNVRAAGTRHLLALDVSGSMTCGQVGGVPGLSPNMAAAAMSLVALRTEASALTMGFAAQFRALNITARDTLEAAMRKAQSASFGATDCAQPMLWAAAQGLEVDTFVVYTDNETWAGQVHPAVALDRYRQKMGIDARLIVVGLTATGFTIADPNRTDMLDVVGFDTAAPGVMADFARGVL
ncbi:RNA-binding protein Rsr [Deinococcus multiflagellatus]|uniref:RNA-binding protein Rsr n=1 Tax=Deinococcus multiflagellatus TaxID=1656887 RepID=UPI001CCA0009|nr:RNA-binding protein Rsr [Deinococcus multiflagellatus]MBZ9712756.1 TROVE domain-containing protein [Deinococcus multiflagellatus]